jgi:hypothetical protein
LSFAFFPCRQPSRLVVRDRSRAFARETSDVDFLEVDTDPRCAIAGNGYLSLGQPLAEIVVRILPPYLRDE